MMKRFRQILAVLLLCAYLPAALADSAMYTCGIEEGDFTALASSAKARVPLLHATHGDCAACHFMAIVPPPEMLHHLAFAALPAGRNDARRCVFFPLQPAARAPPAAPPASF